jgi:antitoxin YefM
MKGFDDMLAVNYSTIRNRLKDYCDKVTDNYETVIVTRKDEKNVVIISLDEYNALMKAAKNAAYLDMLDRSMEQIARGEGKVHELIEVGDD